MHEEIMYPVCPHRNVAAAYQRFLGPDSGGMERFFPEEHLQRADRVPIVRLRASSALAAATRGLQIIARAASHAFGEMSAALSLLLGPRPARLPA